MIDFTTALTDLDGEPIRDGETVLTLGRAVRAALLLSYPDEQNLSADDKLARFMLASKASGRGVTLTAEETVTMKKVIGKGYGPLVVGRAFEMLDPASVSKGTGRRRSETRLVARKRCRSAY